MTFNDIFKSSFLENITEFSATDTLIAMVAALVIGMFIFVVYKKTFNSVMYSTGFAMTLVGMTMVTTLVILAVTSNVVLSLGMVGALSIVRFRAAIKEPMEIVYLFWAVAAGIVIGAGMLPLAVIGSAIIGVILILFANKKVYENPYLLILNCQDENSENAALSLVKESVKKYAVKSKTVEEDLGDAIDMIIDGGPVGIGLESTIVDFTEEVPVVLRPGYISLEMLQQVLGDVRMDRGLIKPDSNIHPKAPGMKYRHYAPKADLAIVEGSTDDVISAINEFVERDQKEGMQSGIIATEETISRYPAGIVKCIGSRAAEETIAHNLYEVLREFDQCQVSRIYSEAFYTPRMGQAIMNRLLKAAGHKIINVGRNEK